MSTQAARQDEEFNDGSAQERNLPVESGPAKHWNVAHRLIFQLKIREITVSLTLTLTRLGLRREVQSWQWRFPSKRTATPAGVRTFPASAKVAELSPLEEQPDAAAAKDGLGVGSCVHADTSTRAGTETPPVTGLSASVTLCVRSK